MNPNLDALVINGDLGDGRSDDYAMLNSILQKYPLPKTVYYTLSNHEFYKAYYIQGYHFIFLGSEQYRQSDPANYEDAWLSSAQLSWLQKKLQENYSPHRPMFVFLHQPLQGTVSGSVERGVVQQMELKQQLSLYPEVIFLSGHTHWELRLPTTLVRDVFTMVNSSSVSYPYDSNDRPIQETRSEGLVIDVYEDRVHIRVRELYTNRPAT